MEIDVFTLTHEIKNPLSISKGYLEMSNENNFGKYKEIIERNIDEALLVLDTYLDYNKLSLNIDIMDLNLLIEDIVNDYNNLYDLNIKFISAYDELYINGDFYKLKQVFNNIIKNSIEANASEIIISTKTLDEIVIINISDNGNGFNNIEDLKYGYSSKVNGNGIGVVISKKIINYHNGIIEYHNNSDLGCNINIKMPIKL